MPATSIAQRRFMAIAEHHPGQLQGKMPNMSQGQLHDFATTPEKGLPSKASKVKAKNKALLNVLRRKPLA